MVIYEHVVGEKTGFRLVTKPNEALKKETLWLQVRVYTSPTSTKLISFELVDDVGELRDLQDEFFDAILQHKIKDIGRKCDCGRYFLPTSPNHKKCDRCKEDK
ncbi:MAG: hypothetical protein ACXABY_02740 [Candidatus Thorarchaeota archaeon]|jgi:hypothetical protein